MTVQAKGGHQYKYTIVVNRNLEYHQFMCGFKDRTLSLLLQTIISPIAYITEYFSCFFTSYIKLFNGLFLSFFFERINAILMQTVDYTKIIIYWDNLIRHHSIG